MNYFTTGRVTLALGAATVLLAGQARATIAFESSGVFPELLQGMGAALGLDLLVTQSGDDAALDADGEDLDANPTNDNADGIADQNDTGAAETSIGSSALFTSATSGAQINAGAFQATSAGTQATGSYGAANGSSGNYNQSPSEELHITSVFDSGSGTISLVGGGRYSYSTASVQRGASDPGTDIKYNPGAAGFSAVPESGTFISGALMLLPFGMGVVRQWRKKLPAA